MEGFGQDFIERKSHEIAELIDLAALGRASWDDVNNKVVDAFPGSSFSAVWNLDPLTGRPKTISLAGLEPTFRDSLLEHYAGINPWNAYWEAMPSGHVAISEQESPAALIAHTEFYNDWLKPLRAPAAVGLKLGASVEDLIIALVHYPLRFADEYDRAAAEILRRVRGNFQRAVDQAIFFGEQAQRSLAATALIERARDMAMAVDIDGRVVEANGPAAAALQAGRPVRSAKGRVSFADPNLDLWFNRTLRQLLNGQPVDCASRTFEIAGESYKMSLASIPEYFSPGPLLVPPRRMALVMIRQLATPLCAETLGDFGRLYKLTPSETRMCAYLASGVSLQESAVALGVTYETARHRVKLLFSKTGVHRQSELVALISNFIR